MTLYEKDCVFFQQQCHILFHLTNEEEYEYWRHWVLSVFGVLLFFLCNSSIMVIDPCHNARIW